MDDIVLYWLNDRDAVTGVKDVSLPQFSVSDYETLNKIETLLTGKLTWSLFFLLFFSLFFVFFFKCTSE